LGATIAPSQPTAAVAGVQVASRQHNSLVPFFQVIPVALTQLSTVWAPATAESAAAATSIASLFSFIMVLLKEKSRSSAASIYKTLRVPITHNVRAIVPQSDWP
jgi:hypothetical protein